MPAAEVDVQEESEELPQSISSQRRRSNIDHKPIHTMSTEPDETHVHLARDGLYYATYQEMRNANVKSNEKRLRELGLDKMKIGRVRPPTTPKKKPPTKSGTTTPSSSFESPMRRSNRVRRVTPELPALEEDPFSEPPRKKAKASLRSRTSPVAAKAVSDKERKLLENLPDWLNSMEEYLSTEENLSRQNLTSVMRQVVKLSTGVGITYSHWGERVAFAKGRPINMSEDFDSLYVEAVEFEEEHGRDLGNGWLLRHPIKKMSNFQQYSLEKRS